MNRWPTSYGPKVGDLPHRILDRFVPAQPSHRFWSRRRAKLPMTSAIDIERRLRERYRQPAGVEQFGIERRIGHRRGARENGSA